MDSTKDSKHELRLRRDGSIFILFEMEDMTFNHGIDFYCFKIISGLLSPKFLQLLPEAYVEHKIHNIGFTA